VKEEDNAGKIKNRMEPGDKNEIEIKRKNIGLDGEEGGDTGEPQQKNCSEYDCSRSRSEKRKHWKRKLELKKLKH